jgi:uncharacterized protein YijF (DUF1287 family)
MHALALSVALAFELGLVLPDRGIFPDLDQSVALTAPARAAAPRLRVDPQHGLVTLYDGDDPLTVWRARVPVDLRGATRADVLPRIELAPAAAAALRAATSDATPVVVGAPPRREDRDGDGIVDRLDILVGAKKLLANGARYIERYVSIKYPGGDVPRTEGVCSDTVIRALRNAGIDLQKEVHEDILSARKAYPMVEKVDASINHRRVKTLLPWFQRHFATLPKGTPYRPGDIVFFDTFPSKSGPDHLGVVSDRAAPSGQPFVINNWTDGATDAEMDLFSFVPVTHHFRARP